MMTSPKRPRIWLHPPKYWKITERMTSQEAEDMMNTVLSLAEKGEVAALRKYEFISVEEELVEEEEDRAA